jgi:hypothetical protein
MQDCECSVCFTIHSWCSVVQNILYAVTDIKMSLGVVTVLQAG